MNPERLRKHLLSKERGDRAKESAFIKVALGYPNTYRTGMSSLGFLTIWRMLNEREDTVAHRFFLDTGGITLEGGRKITLYDVVAFSISYEMDYVNAVKIIRNSGMNVLSCKRREEDPLFIAGGIITFSNPEPIAPFFDVIFLGDGEEVVDRFFDMLREEKEKGKGWKERVKERAHEEFPSVYVPEKGENEKRPHRVEVLDYPGFSPILTPLSELPMMLVEVGRGCPYRCSFCLVGNLQGEVRWRDAEEIIRCGEVEEKIGLLGSAVADHPEFEEILEGFYRMGKEVSVSSLRLDRVSYRVLELLKKLNLHTLTVAPEVSTPRLKKLIRKNITQERLFEFVRDAGKLGFPSLKLYYLFGLPGEDEGDVEAEVEEIEKVKEIFGGRVTASFNLFIPKKGTPMENYPLEEREGYRKKVKIIRKIKGVDVSIMGYRDAFYQTLYSRGDRKIGLFLAGEEEINPEEYVYKNS
ncbi:hypothetical protein DRQ16_00530 [bacterium]|nr:MAG: hypothetical protein DRQ16_00530 [bacterium]